MALGARWLLLLVMLETAFPEKIASNIETRAAVCLTPKLASSQVLDFLHYFVGGFPAGCKYLPRGFLDCPPVPRSTLLSRYHVYHQVGPLMISKLDYPSVENNQTRLSILKHFDTIAVIYRDPWNRLLSAFRDKFVKDCNSDPEKFQRKWLPEYSLDASKDELVRYFEAVLAADPAHLDGHFNIQSSMCLHQRIIGNPTFKLIGVPMETGLNKITDLFGYGGNFSFYKMFGHGPRPTSGILHEVPAGLLGRVYSFLIPDYETLCNLFSTCYPRISEFTNMRPDESVLVETGLGVTMPKSECRQNTASLLCLQDSSRPSSPANKNL